MHTIVSISLGSSSRDFDHEIVIDKLKFRVIRQGVNGDKVKAAKLIKKYDGKVQYIGLGGVNFYYQWENKKYPCPDGIKLAKMAESSIVVDGASIKKVFDWQAVNLLKTITNLSQKKVLIVSALDRPHLIDFFKDKAYSYLIGDAIFALKLPLPFYSKDIFGIAVNLTMPFLKYIPIELLYPTGKKQDVVKCNYLSKFANYSDIICGDFHLFRRMMPSSLNKKIIVTSTITNNDLTLIKELGGEALITSSPYFNNRALGANVWEALLCTLYRDLRYEIKLQTLLNILFELKIRPSLFRLN